MSKGVFVLLDTLIRSQSDNLTRNERLMTWVNQYKSKHKIMPSFAEIDRTNLVYVTAEFRPCLASAFEYLKLKNGSGGIVSLGTRTNTVVFDLNANNGEFVHDMVLNVRLPAISSHNYRFRYCAYPGARIIKSVRLRSNSNPIDDYTREDFVSYFKKFKSVDTRLAFDRMLGQQEIQIGGFYNTAYATQQILAACDGNQTFRNSQPEINLWIPLIFDFNTELKRSLFNRMITTLQFYVDVEFAPIDEIVQACDNDGVAVSLSTASMTSLSLKATDLYCKNIYFMDQIRDLIQMRSHMSIMRVNKHQSTILTAPRGRILLEKLKYPVEVMNIRFTPRVNSDVTNIYNFDDWHIPAVVTRSELPVPAFVPSALPPFVQLVVRTGVFPKITPTISSLSLSINGQYLYQKFPESFFDSYNQSFITGLSSDPSIGNYTIPFSHYPTAFDPSGHINMSVTREVFIEYESDFIDVAKTLWADAHIWARCINMYVMDADGIQLKYTT